MSHNPAAQITSLSRSNEAVYSWSPPADGIKMYSHDSLNRLTSVVHGGSTQTISYDSRGNVTGDGVDTFTYDIINRLTQVTDSGTAYHLSYDSLGRLKTVQKGSGATTTFLYSGSQLIAEYNGSTVLRRYVHGPGTDEPLIWYEGSGSSDRRWLHTDSRGSIIAGIPGEFRRQYT